MYENVKIFLFCLTIKIINGNIWIYYISNFLNQKFSRGVSASISVRRNIIEKE